MVVTNMPQMLAAVTRAERAIGHGAIKEAVEEAGEIYAAEWKSLVPEREGHYKESIQTGEVTQNAAGQATVSVWPHHVGGVEASQQPSRYAGVLEFGGTVNRGAFVPAQPSMRPAFDNAQPKAEFVVKRAIAKRIAGLGIAGI
jgi:HK97 gp10 family phage protein